MSNTLVQRNSLNAKPRCGGCGNPESVAPSMNSRKAPYFCIHCCNYMDSGGNILCD